MPTMQSNSSQLLGLSSTDFGLYSKSKSFLNTNISVLSSASTICSSERSDTSDVTVHDNKMQCLGRVIEKNKAVKEQKSKSLILNSVKKAIGLKTCEKSKSLTNHKKQLKILRSLSKCKLNQEYELLNRSLGDGSNGKVYLVKRLKDDKLMAAKNHLITKPENKDNLKKIKNEIVISSKMHHLNIAKIYDVVTLKNSIFTIGEYCYVDLFDYVNTNVNSISEAQMVQFYVQLISGVSYIHHQGIVHRDLKLENICVTSGGVLKIIDFGCAVVYNDMLYDSEKNKSRLVTGITGSDPYMAPEVWANEFYDGIKADTFSLGVVFVAMASLKFMWQTTKSSDTKFASYKMSRNKRAYFAKLKIPSCAISSIIGMLEPDYTIRKSVGDLWNESWVEETVCKSKLSN